MPLSSQAELIATIVHGLHPRPTAGTDRTVGSRTHLCCAI
jgi:hypothetical protein